MAKGIGWQHIVGDELRQQFIRFLQVGVLNTVGTYLMYLTLIQFIPYAIAYSFTFVVGVLFSAWLNARYSFTVQLIGRTLTRFAVIYVISFVLSIQLLIIFQQTADFL